MRTWLKRAILGCAALVLAAALGLWWGVGWDGAVESRYPGGVVLRDANGEIIRVTLGAHDVDCRPTYVADPGDWIVKAAVAAEDGEFWHHRGVRPGSVLRAAFQNLVSGRRVSGASTITMQAVRLMAPHPHTLGWKAVEAVRALKLERRHDKRWILSQYLNRAPFGANLVGIEAAARGWFGKSARELGIAEAACLAGMVQAPSRFRPDRALGAALARRRYVLQRMRDCGYITEEQRSAADAVIPEILRAPRPFKYPHYCDWALAATNRDDGVAAAGDLRTALNPDVESILREEVDAAAREGGYAAAAVTIDVASGAVIALACSGDYFAKDSGQVNTALAPRPAGSTLKPLLAARAMDRGLVTPEERLDDAPMVFGDYRPADFDAKTRGPVTLRDALVLSLNLPFVRLLNRVGVDDFAATLRRSGFDRIEGGAGKYGLGLAIGNAEITLVELAGAYAAVARGGKYRAPSVTADPTAPAEEIFTPGACYLISDMLSGDERSRAALGHIADVPTPRFAWKTGTSAAYRDAWTVAWNPEYAVAVWCGHLAGGFYDRKLVGARAAAPVAWRIIRRLYPDGKGPWFAPPPSVFERRICAQSGLPAGADCVRTETGRALAGRTPNLVCAAHRPAAKGAAVPAQPLQIAKPADGAEFHLLSGVPQQQIVFEALGAGKTECLWWFLDDRPVGETFGRETLALPMTVGSHRAVCVTAAGRQASVAFNVLSD